MILAAHAMSTAFMAGLIWWVQLVHYPLFAQVGAENFLAFHYEHVRRATWVVTPIMTLEALTAILLLWVTPTDFILWLGTLLIIFIWSLTAWVQVPLHRQLENGFDPGVHSRLVSTNWMRTAAWSIRCALMLELLVGLRGVP